MKFDDTTNSSMAQEIIDAIASGTASAPKLQIFSGAVPENVGDPYSGTLLAELELDNSVGSEANGVITFAPISDDSSANATGEPTWARILDRDGVPRVHLTASGQGGEGELQVNPGTITSGEPVAASLGIIRVGV